MPLVGTTRNCRITFTSSGAFIDPAVVSVLVRKPDHTEVDMTASIVHDSLGHYHVPVPLDQAGKWVILWTATGVSAQEIFNVDSSVAGVTAPQSVVTQVGMCSGWVLWEDFVDYCGVDPTQVSPVQIQSALDQATEWLYIKSAFQFPGVCTETARPYGQDCSAWFPWVSSLAYYNWAYVGSGYGYGYGAWGWGCDCNTLQQVDLGYWPLIAVTQVKLNGVVLTPSVDYRVDEQRWLVRLPDSDGTIRYWPACQRMDLQDTEDETWSVTVEYGRGPGPLGIKAAKELGKQFLGACGTGDCAIPLNATSLNRQGVSYQLVDFTSMPEGRLGLAPVDAFLDAYNPNHLFRPTQVWSPDIPRTTRRIGT